MRKKQTNLKVLNANFYNLIRSLQKKHFTRSASIVSYAYEIFLNELIKMYHDIN